MNKDIGQLIKELRKGLNLTQDEISEKIGISRSNYSQIERGNSMPTFVNLKKIVNILEYQNQILQHAQNK